MYNKNRLLAGTLLLLACWLCLRPACHAQAGTTAAGAGAPSVKRSGQEPLPKEWKCPASPSKWFPSGADEVIETDARWREYLKISGFKPPLKVDFGKYHIALFTFIGGGGSYLRGFKASRTDGKYTLTLVSSHRGGGEGMVVTADIVYDCRLFLVPRRFGTLELAHRTSDTETGLRDSDMDDYDKYTGKCCADAGGEWYSGEGKHCCAGGNLGPDVRSCRIASKRFKFNDWDVFRLNVQCQDRAGN